MDYYVISGFWGGLDACPVVPSNNAMTALRAQPGTAVNLNPERDPLMPSLFKPRLLLCVGPLLMAQVLAQNPREADTSAGVPATTLDAIIVTAGKRNESVREIAGSISVVGNQQLQALGAQSLADYVNQTPGVVFNQYQPGVSHVVMRGIATSSGNVQGQPTTGYFLNEIPLTEPGWTIAIPDVDTFDLNRVEVLRGPQGTLFGSASMGGAVNYVANIADSRSFDAAAETGISQTRNAGMGYAAKAMVNVPVSEDLFAFRALAHWRDDPGWLDNSGISRRGSNGTEVSGGRLSMALTPSDATTLTWLSLVQNIDNDDNSYRIAGLGEFERNTAIAEFTDTSITVHGLRLEQDLGSVQLTALLARQNKRQDWRFDFTPLRGAYNADLDLDLQSPLYIASGGRSRGNSLEIRLASTHQARFEWLVGTMYFDTGKDLHEQLGSRGAAAEFEQSSLFGPGSGAVIASDGEIFNAFYSRVDGSEAAVFGEGDIHFNSAWTLTLGGRFFRNRISSVNTEAGFSTWPGAPVVTRSRVQETGFNPKLALRWKSHADLLWYASISEGFRFGEPNSSGLSAYPVPAGSSSDRLVNYEIGVRSGAGNGRFVLDATVFYVDWKDIQLRLQTPDLFNYASNGGKAYSRGVEFAATWRPVESFQWQMSATWQRARLDEDLEILYVGTAPAGAQLPGSAEWTVSNFLSYRFDAAFQPTMTLIHQYVGSGVSDLNSLVPGVMPNRQGNYNTLDLRYRMSFGALDVSVFAHNLTDKRGITRTVAEVNGIGEGVLRPRTLGMSLHWRY